MMHESMNVKYPAVFQDFLYSIRANHKAGHQIQSALSLVFCFTYSIKYGEKRGAYRVLVGKPEENGNLEDPGVDGSIGGHGLD
jgi:hypothetical protein